MNKQELIEVIKNEPYEKGIFMDTIKFNRNWLLRKIEKLDEPEAGHADVAPRYVKNILARLRELPLHDREVWLKAIMGEFEQDFSHAKWREGYGQGKFEGMVEHEKVKVPQCVADWYEINKDNFDKNIVYLCLNWEKLINDNNLFNWMSNTDNFIQILVNMHQFGYEVEKEKRYLVKLKGIFKGCEYLNFKFGRVWTFSNEEENEEYRTCHTKKELEEANFGWVFSCEGIEIEEVK